VGAVFEKNTRKHSGFSAEETGSEIPVYVVLQMVLLKEKHAEIDPTRLCPFPGTKIGFKADEIQTVARNLPDVESRTRGIPAIYSGEARLRRYEASPIVLLHVGGASCRRLKKESVMQLELRSRQATRSPP